MKILKVEFENINSLKGKWCIDFTDPSFEANDNLFAICGPTGSGKSSILDAITLAIYGRTPRQKLIYKGSGNEVMTRDTGNCSARVTYKCMRGTFVTEWSQRRARDNAQGNLQDANGLVYAIEKPENPIFNARTGTGMELANVNASNIQLDYSQFCRSIMLAQGEFGVFLTCEEDERAKILEKLNGTEKYRKIAVKAGENWSKSKAERDRIEAACSAVSKNMLTAEDIAEKSTKREALQKELEGLEKSQKEMDQLLNWYANLDERRKILDDSIVKLDYAKNAKENFKSEGFTLERAVCANNCETAFGKVKLLRQSKETLEKELADLKIKLQEQNRNLDSVKALAEKTADELLQAEAFVKENGALWNEVRTLDANVKNAFDNAKNAADNYESCSCDFRSCEKSEKDFLGEVDTLTRRIAAGSDFIEKNASDKGIADILSGFRAQIENCRDCERGIAEEKVNVLKAEAESRQLKQSIETCSDALEVLDKYLAEHKDCETIPQVVAENRGVADELKKACSEKARLVVEMDRLKSEGETLDKRLLESTQKISGIEDEQLELFNSDVIVLADVIQKHLVEGSPCPVCGSIDHPCFSHGASTESSAHVDNHAVDIAQKIRSLNEKLESERSAKNRIEGDCRQNKANLENAASDFEKAEKVCAQSIEKLNAAFAPWNVLEGVLDNEAPVDELVNTLGNAFSRLQALYKEFSEKKSEREKVDLEKRDFSSRLGVSDSNLCNSRSNLEKLCTNLNAISQKMEESVSQWISNFRIEDLESIYKTLESRSQKFCKAQELFEELQKDLSLSESNLDSARVSKESAGKRLSEAEKLRESTKAELEKLELERKSKFGEQNVENVESAARSKVESAKGANAKADAELRKLQDCVNTLQSQISQREKDIANGNADLSCAESAFLQVLSQNGFADSSAFEASRIPAEEFTALQQKKQAIENDILKALQSNADAEDAYKRCMAEHSGVTPREELVAGLSQKNARVDEVRRSLVEVESALKANECNNDSLKTLQAEYDKANANFMRWSTMHEWFGKMDGSEFSKFVQGLTFKSLLLLANRKLHEIKGRYTLVAKGDLGFEIEDTHFNGRRSISNLSGGEKFLVSLSLALGIADFASRNVKIESLFLDEGFGTLDGVLLQDVMDCLKSQHKQGKMLGVITHMDALKEEFTQKIQVNPHPDGHSELAGPGVRAF